MGRRNARSATPSTSPIDGRIYYVDKVDDPDGVRMSSRVGREVDPVRTAAGRAILAQLPDDDRDHLLNGLSAEERRRLEARLREVRDAG